MMEKKDTQLRMIVINLGELVPEKHLLRRITEEVDFEFIYEKAEQYYSPIRRPSIDPVCIMKMLLTGYLYGIKSERRLTEEVSLNIAYRWFCGFELDEKIPDHFETRLEIRRGIRLFRLQGEQNQSQRRITIGFIA